jgi:hypothetical protein
LKIFLILKPAKKTGEIMKKYQISDSQFKATNYELFEKCSEEEADKLFAIALFSAMALFLTAVIFYNI